MTVQAVTLVITVHSHNLINQNKNCIFYKNFSKWLMRQFYWPSSPKNPLSIYVTNFLFLEINLASHKKPTSKVPKDDNITS